MKSRCVSKPCAASAVVSPATRTPNPPAWEYWSGPSKLRLTKTVLSGVSSLGTMSSRPATEVAWQRTGTTVPKCAPPRATFAAVPCHASVAKASLHHRSQSHPCGCYLFCHSLVSARILMKGSGSEQVAICAELIAEGWRPGADSRRGHADESGRHGWWRGLAPTALDGDTAQAHGAGRQPSCYGTHPSVAQTP